VTYSANPSQTVDTVLVQITSEHHVAEAQWAAKSLAHSLGLSKVATYSIATAVSELANNIFFHTDAGGTITLTALKQNGRVGIEILAQDEGPGIANLDLALKDGFTTNGGLGGGLPGVQRLVDEFDITSSPRSGTRIMARKWDLRT